MTETTTKHVAVTGAGGFIASHLVEALLAAGHTVRALVHYNALGSRGHLEEVISKLDEDTSKRLEIMAGDICDARCTRELVSGCSQVFHLAALIGIPYSYIAPQSYVHVNINGTLNLLEVCRDLEIERLVHTSTSEVYGTARTTPMNELHPLQAQSPYSATKIAADKLAESYYLSFGLPVVTMRPFNTYGPRQSLRAVIPTIIAQALSDKCSNILLGALDPVRDLTFVTDTAKAFLLAAQSPAEKTCGRVYNLGTGRGINIGSLAKLILETLKIDKPIECKDDRLRPKKSEVRLLISDNTMAKNELGWKPETSLEDGIKKTAEWMKSRLDQIDPEVYVR